MNQYDAVSLPFIQQQPEENVAPQFVQNRSTNQSLIYLDSRSQYKDSSGNIIENNIANAVYSTVKGPGESASNLIKDCKRINVASIYFNLYLKNINRFNKTFQVSYNGGPYVDVNLIEGYYDTAVALVNMLLGALGTATGVVWSVVAPYSTASSKTSIHNAAGLPFQFRGVEKLKYVYGFPTNQTTLMVIGPIFGFYTRYIDVNSATVTRYAKIKSSSNNNNNGTQIFRFYLENMTFVRGLAIGGGSVFNWNRTDFSPQIDISLEDEFGNELIIDQEETSPGYMLTILKLEV